MLTTFHWKNPALLMLTGFFGLTEDSLLTVAYKVNLWQGGFKPVVTDFREFKFNKTVFWDFKKMKDTKGRTWGLEFSFESSHPPTRDVTYKTDLTTAEKFQEIFEVNANRFSNVKATADIAQQLSAMSLLFQEGVLTESEFKRSKEIFLGKSADQEQQAERALRSLKQLKDAGVLTDAEFATKKWDVISDKRSN